MPASVRVGEGSEYRAGGVLAAALASAALFSASIPIPLLFVLAMVSPFPLVVLRLRSGALGALMSTLMATALIAAAFSTAPALVFLFLLAMPGLVMAEVMGRGRGLRRGCAWAFAVLAAQIGGGLLLAGPGIAARTLESFDQYRSPQFLAEMRVSLPAEQVDAWAERWTLIHEVMSVVYPAVYVIWGAVIILANAALLRAYLARRDPGWLDGGEFEGIRWPLGMAVVFVAAGLSVVVPPLRPAGYNVLLVVAFFFAIQGLAVAAYYAHRLAGPPLLRAAVIVLVILNPWAPQILALLGLFDLWFDFRRWAEPPEAEED